MSTCHRSVRNDDENKTVREQDGKGTRPLGHSEIKHKETPRTLRGGRSCSGLAFISSFILSFVQPVVVPVEQQGVPAEASLWSSGNLQAFQGSGISGGESVLPPRFVLHLPLLRQVTGSSAPLRCCRPGGGPARTST